MKRHRPEETIMEGMLDLKELAEAYVTGGLSGEERRDVDARLRSGDRALQREIDAVEDALSLLATRVTPVPPPAEAKTRLFETLRALESGRAESAALTSETSIPALD